MRWIIALLTLFALACGRPDPQGGKVGVSLVTGRGPAQSIIRVTGLSGSELRALKDAELGDQAWLALLRVGVGGNDVAPVLGRYVVEDGALEFHPRFPFDRGQPYSVRFDRRNLTPGGG